MIEDVVEILGMDFCQDKLEDEVEADSEYYTLADIRGDKDEIDEK